MTKFLLTYKESIQKRAFYAYDASNFQNVSIPANEVIFFLKEFANYKIINIIEKNSEAIEITFENGYQLVINDIRVFKTNKNHEADEYILKLLNNINSFLNKKNYQNNKNRFPNNYQPKVNRNKNKRRKNSKLIISGISLSLAIVLNFQFASYYLNKSIKQKDSDGLDTTISENMRYNNLEFNHKLNYDYENNTVEEETIEKKTNYIASLAFDDKTENGKLEQTIENCSIYLEPLIERYGLPRELTYALVTQEYGILDCQINAGGACGPMQIQVTAMHNDNAIEHIVVPTYENGIPTGEYDDFYIADARKLDDPRLVGKNYLVMQNLEDNFKIGCACLRRCIDKYKNIFIAIDAYNKGLYAMSSCVSDEQLEYYKAHFEDFSWTNIIPSKYGTNYGDSQYIWNVLRYLDTDVRGNSQIEYYYEGELITVDLTNTNVYNNEITRS